MKQTKIQSSVIRRTGEGNALVEIVVCDEADVSEQAFFLHVRVSLADLDKTPMRAIIARALAEAAKTATAEIAKLKPRRRPTLVPVNQLMLVGTGEGRAKKVTRARARFGS
jgi:hypothetical protein